jgi:UDP-glucose 4-epimerase
MMHQRCAITGASGFVGSRLSQKLIDEGYDVIRLHRNDTSPVSWTLQPNIDIIIHCAAYIPTNYNDFDQAQKCMMDNGIATLELFRAAHEHGIKTFIYFSTGQAYRWNDEPSYEVSEREMLDPTERASIYLISKIAGEQYIKSYKSHNMRVIILRPASIYGDKSHGLLDRIITAIDNSQFTIPNYNIDLVHVDDIVSMVIICIKNEKISGIYNVGGKESRSVARLAIDLANIMKKPSPFQENVKIPKLVGGHPRLNIEQAWNVGYRPRSIKDGLVSYIRSLT